jgi:putative FmdB family regulatory protein
MPIYEYRCSICQTEFEQFVRSMSSNAEVSCPNCGGTDVKKGWSVFGMGMRDGHGMRSPGGAVTSCTPAGT